MPIVRTRNWMWSDAVELLDRVDRLHRQSFAPGRASGGMACWEPPVDIVETDDEVVVLVALPGVDPDRVDAAIEDGVLIVSGQRILPPQFRSGAIHRLELPQGRFERRLALPAGHYDAVARTGSHGCLLVTLRKLREARR